MDSEDGTAGETPGELVNTCGDVMLLAAEELTYGDRDETALFDGVLGGEMSCTLPIGLPGIPKINE